MARRQRIRRFLSNSRIDVTTFTPALLRPLFLGVDEVMLSMDRTEWHRRGQVVNVLSVAIVLDGITCPLYWIVLSRPGATGLQYWQQVLTPAVDALRCAQWLQRCPLTVAADREFASPKLAEVSISSMATTIRRSPIGLLCFAVGNAGSYEIAKSPNRTTSVSMSPCCGRRVMTNRG